MLPILVACSHGTSSREGQRAVRELVDAVAARRPELDVRAAFVDVEEPRITAVLTALAGVPATVVPLLLSTGYHVYVDLAAATAATPDTTLTGALGPDRRLAELLARRLHATGLLDDDVVILAAAGSSEPRALRDCETVAEALGDVLGRTVSAAYLSTAEPQLTAAVREARGRASGRVVVATYLLAPGHFLDVAARCGADVVMPPLLLPNEPAPTALVEIVLERYGC